MIIHVAGKALWSRLKVLQTEHNLLAEAGPMPPACAHTHTTWVCLHMAHTYGCGFAGGSEDDGEGGVALSSEKCCRARGKDGKGSAERDIVGHVHLLRVCVYPSMTPGCVCGFYVSVVSVSVSICPAAHPPVCLWFVGKCVVCMSAWYGRALAVPSTLEPKPPSREGMVLLPVALVYLTPPHPTLIGPDWGIEGKEIGLLCKVHRPIYASILQSCIWKNLP